MEYTIAAYVIVVGALVAYGLRVHQQRRALIRRAAEPAASTATATATDEPTAASSS